MQPGAAFPLNWLLFRAPLQDGGLNLNLFHWHWVGMHWLGAVFMYFYCRELERSRTASLLAGCAFSFGGFVGTVTWPQVLNGAVWTPLSHSDQEPILHGERHRWSWRAKEI